MAIEVIFRGPTLYLNRGDVAEMALVPNAERVIFSDSGKPGRHADDTKTATHYAGLLIVEGADKDTVVMRAELSGKIVTLIDGPGMTCALHGNFGELVPIDDVANHAMTKPMALISAEANDYWIRVAARVLFRGGELRSAVVSPATFRIDGGPEVFKAPRPLPLSATWKAESGDVHIQLCDADGSDCVRVSLREGQTAYIYNWDVKEPVAKTLDTFPAVKDSGEDITDADFKWIYELFVPPVSNFTQWLGGKGKVLRAPITTFRDVVVLNTEIDTPNPGSSSCASARASLS
jgi:hypothetical protein